MPATTKKPGTRKVGRPAKTKKEPIAAAEVHKEAPVQHEPKRHVAKHPTTQNFYAVGKRKTAVAQTILSSGSGVITVNDLPFEAYFMTADLQNIVGSPLVAVGVDKKVSIRSKIHGGGIHAQAESLRHAIARALILMDPESRRTLKKLGFLTRDPRVKERKKPGLKRARRAPQFSKR
jgi:small subunit ribosomal protein S9